MIRTARLRRNLTLDDVAGKIGAGRRAVSDAARMSPLRRGPLDVLLGRWSLDNSPVFIAMDLMTRLFSPYDFPSGATNPLTDILAECVDFPRLVRAPISRVRFGRLPRMGCR